MYHGNTDLTFNHAICCIEAIEEPKHVSITQKEDKITTYNTHIAYNLAGNAFAHEVVNLQHDTMFNKKTKEIMIRNSGWRGYSDS